MKYWHHETAIVDEGATIGKGTKIWHFSHICGTADIGKNCSIGQNVYIDNDVLIGNHCKIQNNVSIYKGVSLDDEVFCGPSMVFTNVFNPRTEVNRKKELRKTLVNKGVSFGANCTIICGVTIGEYALIGAGAVVRKDVKPYALMIGVPARQIGWMSQFGEQLDLPLTGVGETLCPKTGKQYFLKKDQVQVER